MKQNQAHNELKVSSGENKLVLSQIQKRSSSLTLIFAS